MLHSIPSYEDTDANIQNIKEQNYRAFAFEFKQESSTRLLRGRFMGIDGDMYWMDIARLKK